MGRQPCGHQNPQVGRRGDDPVRSPGRPAITDLGFREQKLRAGPRERGRGEDPCTADGENKVGLKSQSGSLFLLQPPAPS